MSESFDPGATLAALARLERQLADRDQTIADLESKLADQDQEREADSWRWTQHQAWKADPRPELPLPRLELVLEPTWAQSWHEFSATLFLVRRTWDGQVAAVPLAAAVIQHSGNWLPIDPATGEWYTGRVGYDARAASRSLGVPGYLISDGQVRQIPHVPADASQEAQ